jgi:hypothetical protein
MTRGEIVTPSLHPFDTSATYTRCGGSWAQCVRIGNTSPGRVSRRRRPVSDAAFASDQIWTIESPRPRRTSAAGRRTAATASGHRLLGRARGTA